MTQHSNSTGGILRQLNAKKSQENLPDAMLPDATLAPDSPTMDIQSATVPRKKKDLEALLQQCLTPQNPFVKIPE